MPDAARQIAIVAGSGLDRLADHFETRDVVAFESIGLGAPTVDGHRGEVRICETLGAGLVLVLGRRHFYERAHDKMDRLVEWLVEQRTTDLISISAAGSLQPEAPTGEFVVVSDIIDLQHRLQFAVSPAGSLRDSADAGMARPSPRGRMHIDPGLTGQIEAAAVRTGVGWSRGVLACGAGPTYETHAEVRWLRGSGADLVTMSAAPELAAANRYDLRTAVLAVLTNPATGIRRAVPGHQEVLDAAGHAVGALASVIVELTANK